MSNAPSARPDERLRAPAHFLRGVPTSIIVTDLRGTITHWNEGATALFGYTAEEMLGRTPALLYPDPEQATLDADLAAILAGRDHSGEWQGRRSDGTLIWMDVITTCLRGGDGIPIGFIGVATAGAAREQAERYRLLFAATEALAAALDPGQAPQRIAELAVAALADWCSVGTLEEDGGVRWLGMAHRDPAMPALLAQHGRWTGLRTPPEAGGIFRDALASGQSQIAARVSDEQLRVIAQGDEEYLAFLRGLGPISLVAVPLATRGRLVGVIEYMATGEGRAFTADGLQALEDLARRVALALETARLYGEAQGARAAAAAHARELEATFEAMADGVVVYDRQARMVRMNSAARALFGLDGGDGFTALPLEERVRLLRVRDAAGRPLSSDMLVPDRVLRGDVLTGERGVILGMTTLDGREIMVEAGGTALRDAVGAVVGAVVVYRDVTESRAAEQALRRQAALLTLAHDAIIERAPDGTIVRWNAGAEVLYGWTAAEAEGRVTHDLLRTRVIGGASAAERHAGTTGRDIDAALPAVGAWEGTLEHTRRDGTPVVVESRQALLRDAGDRPTAILEINRDLTAREAFLAGIAHDLKTPLTVILGHAQLATGRLARLAIPEVAPVAQHLAQIATGIRSLAGMVNELADTARLRMGAALDLELQPVDAVALVRAVAAQQEGLTGHRLAVEAAIPRAEVPLDARRMERALGNLLSNAIKYSPAGSTIAVRLAPVDDERGPGLAIAVQDPGLGIPAADLPHIFEPFHRGHNVAGVVPGTGLGLAGARAIVERHGGSITAESVEGAGTTMRVWLPRTPGALRGIGDESMSREEMHDA